MKPGETPRKSLDRVAAELIGLENDREVSERMTALCRKLRDDDFLPDPLAHEAILTLSGRTPGMHSSLLHETNRRHERSLVEAVEHFADEFFSIPVADRISRWKELAEGCKGRNWLINRLLDLKAGLKIDPRTLADSSPAVRQLTEDLLELFPLRQASHATESRARAFRFRDDPRFTPTERSRALKKVFHRHKSIAALSRGHLETLGWTSKAVPAQSWLARVIRTLKLKFDEQPQLLVLFIGCLMAGLLLLAWVARPDLRSRPRSLQKSASTPPAKTKSPSLRSSVP